MAAVEVEMSSRTHAAITKSMDFVRTQCGRDVEGVVST
jgi:hypothetical protein